MPLLVTDLRSIPFSSCLVRKRDIIDFIYSFKEQLSVCAENLFAIPILEGAFVPQHYKQQDYCLLHKVWWLHWEDSGSENRPVAG